MGVATLKNFFILKFMVYNFKHAILSIFAEFVVF